jgi:predicted PurR-regulated permease PerM
MVQPAAESRRVTQLLFYGAVILLALLVYRIVSPFLVQIGWAAVLAICVHPWHARLARRFGSNRGALLSTLTVLLLLIVPAVLVSMAIVSEGTQLVGDVKEVEKGVASEKARQAWDWARTHLPLPPVEEIRARLTSAAAGVAGRLAARAGSLVANAAGFVFDLLLTIFILFFMLRDAASITGAVSRILPFDDQQRRRLLTLTRDLVSASVTTSLAIAALQGLLGGITLALLGVRGAVLWGVVMAFASLIPLVGTGLVWVPAALLLLLSGETARAVILVAVAILVIGNVDNVLRPLLLGGRAQMPTVVIFVSLMGGVSAFGFIGLVLGPLVVAMALALLESYLPEALDLGDEPPVAPQAPPAEPPRAAAAPSP